MNQTIEMIYKTNAKNIHRKVCYLNRLLYLCIIKISRSGAVGSSLGS